MTFIFMRQDLAIDLGTANTVIFHNDKIILDEPSIIAVETKTGKLIAVGAEAQLIEDHANPDIMTIRPLMNGVIADYDAAETMLSGFIKKALRGLALSSMSRAIRSRPSHVAPVQPSSIQMITSSL